VVPTAPAEATAAAPAAQSVSASAEDRFGLRVDKKQQKAGELTELSATATAISAKPRGELMITLDNGQVWGEIAPGSKIKVNAGDTVKIEAGTLGSFILIAPNGRSSKVARIR
jgi:quercetin dioxygenase-like cupin family protein